MENRTHTYMTAKAKGRIPTFIRELQTHLNEAKENGCFALSLHHEISGNDKRLDDVKVIELDAKKLLGAINQASDELNLENYDLEIWVEKDGSIGAEIFWSLAYHRLRFNYSRHPQA